MLKVIVLLSLIALFRLDFAQRVYPFLERFAKTIWISFNQFYDKKLDGGNQSFYTALFRATFYPGIILIITLLSIDIVADLLPQRIGARFHHELLFGYINIVSVVLIAFAMARVGAIVLLFIKRIKMSVHISFEAFVVEFSIVILFTVLAFAIDYYLANRYLVTAFNTLPQEIFYRQFFGFFYFSLVTLATVGYGDIIPTCLTTKVLTCMEIIQAFCLIIIILTNYGNFAKKSNLDDK